jgi:uncharacterized protein DUF87
MPRAKKTVTSTSFKIRLGPELTIDAQTCLEDRLYIGAMSGAGKTHLVRLFVESVAEQIPTIIFDPKSEYATLREKFDFVLVGRQGEVSADVRTAARLARQVIEKRLNVIVDLPSVGSRQMQQDYIKAFLDAMENLPQKLWGPTFVVIDEVHRFCPQKESPSSKSSIITLIDSGRVKGFCAVIASQRQAKVAADARSECANVLQGRVTFPVELRAVSDLLGLSGKGDWNEVKKLRTGEFFAIGPAFATRDLHRGFTFEKTKTTHLSGSNRFVTPPSPSRRIKEIVGELDELLRAPEPVTETPGAMKKLSARIKELETQLVAARTVPVRPAKPTVVVDEAATRRAYDDGWTNAVVAMKQEILPQILGSRRTLVDLADKLSAKSFMTRPNRPATTTVSKPKVVEVPTPRVAKAVRSARPAAVAVDSDGDKIVLGGNAAGRILAALLMHPRGATVTRKKVCWLAKMVPGSSTMRGACSTLVKQGYLQYFGADFGATDKAHDDYPHAPKLSDDREETLAFWANKFGSGATRRGFDALVERGGRISRADFAEAIDTALGSSTMRGALATLRKTGVIDYDGDDVVFADFLQEQ